MPNFLINVCLLFLELKLGTKEALLLREPIYTYSLNLKLKKRNSDKKLQMRKKWAKQ